MIFILFLLSQVVFSLAPQSNLRDALRLQAEKDSFVQKRPFQMWLPQDNEDDGDSALSREERAKKSSGYQLLFEFRQFMKKNQKAFFFKNASLRVTEDNFKELEGDVAFSDLNYEHMGVILGLEQVSVTDEDVETYSLNVEDPDVKLNEKTKKRLKAGYLKTEKAKHSREQLKKNILTYLDEKKQNRPYSNPLFASQMTKTIGELMQQREKDFEKVYKGVLGGLFGPKDDPFAKASPEEVKQKTFLDVLARIPAALSCSASR